jgi:hypothetical protein
MLSRILSVAAITLVPICAHASPKVDMSCLLHFDSPGSCTPLVACLPEANIYFTGRALGWNEGTFAGNTSADFSCTGTWRGQNMFGLGQAIFECDNGLTGAAYFTYQDVETGTATGSGVMSNGMNLQVWSGRNIQQFLVNETGDVDAPLMCGDVQVPIS